MHDADFKLYSQLIKDEYTSLKKKKKLQTSVDNKLLFTTNTFLKLQWHHVSKDMRQYYHRHTTSKRTNNSIVLNCINSLL